MHHARRRLSLVTREAWTQTKTTAGGGRAAGLRGLKGILLRQLRHSDTGFILIFHIPT